MLKIFIALSLICAIVSPIPKERVLVAINCGGQSYVDGNGIIYEKVLLFNFRTIISMQVRLVTMDYNMILN
jgi:hypothetical protein